MAEWALVLPNNTTLGLTENNGLAVVGISGAGMPPIENIYTPYGLGDGALWQRASVQPRLVTVLIDAVGTSWVGLHNLRAKLIEAVNPHEATPITLKYSAGVSKPDLYLDCYYDSGLEGGVTEGFMEKGMALRLLAVDPYWYQDTETTVDLAHIQTVTDVNYAVWQEADGTVNNMDTGTNSTLYRVTEFGGNVQVFGFLMTQAGSIPVTVTGIAEWDGTEWSDPAPPWDTLPGRLAGTGYIDSEYADCAYGPSSVYMAASYGTGGGPAYGVWKYGGGTSWTWYATSARVYRLGVSPSGEIHAAFANQIWRYDIGTSSWVSLGSITTGFVNTVSALQFSPSGTLYIGGSFDNVGGVTVTRVAKYEGGAWYALGNGLNNTVRAFAINAAGVVYAGGDFTASGSVSLGYVAAWNGVSWQPVGGGLGGAVRELIIDQNGRLIATGTFTSAGDGRALPSRAAVLLDNLLLDMGSGYISGMTGVSGSVVTASGLYLVGPFSGTWTAAGTTSVTNSGTARAYPVITLTGPGALYYVINWTTDQRLYFDLTLLDGETLTIDLRPGIKTITSNFRGNCLPFLVSGNLIDWYLDPGANDIGVWIDHADADADISFKPRYWSSDGNST